MYCISCTGGAGDAEDARRAVDSGELLMLWKVMCWRPHSYTSESLHVSRIHTESQPRHYLLEYLNTAHKISSFMCDDIYGITSDNLSSTARVLLALLVVSVLALTVIRPLIGWAMVCCGAQRHRI